MAYSRVRLENTKRQARLATDAASYSAPCATPGAGNAGETPCGQFTEAADRASTSQTQIAREPIVTES